MNAENNNHLMPPKKQSQTSEEPVPYQPVPGMVFSIELLKTKYDFRLKGWPITVVEMPFYEQAQGDFHSHDTMEIGIVMEG
ncbi:MAG: hypothetical protein MJ106_07730, partial [Lentisphaeria bacterium]|nr:hypothetical protein [Lentisphaeria bacterium]